MSTRADRSGWVKDGNRLWDGGVDENTPPSKLKRNQSARGINVTFRGLSASPRPGFQKKPIVVGEDISAAFKDGRFQHAAFWDGNGIPQLLASISGRQFKIDVHSWQVQEITPQKAAPTTTLGYTKTRANFFVPVMGADVTVGVDSIADMVNGTYVAIASVWYTLISFNPVGPTITIRRQFDSGVDVDGKEIGFPYGVWFIIVITPAPSPPMVIDQNNPNQKMCWSVQAENYWILQDNQSLPIIFNGAEARRSDLGAYEVPVGNVMAYTMGRLAVALPDRYSYRIGDLVFGPSGNANDRYRDAMLKFTENNYLNEGGDLSTRIFGALSVYGNVEAMIPLAMLDQQLGQGPMFVGQPYMCFTVQLPFDRTTWKNLNSPMQTASPLLGPVSQTGTINVNGDVWYRSLDGVRSFITARRDFSSWGNTPMSGEVEKTISFDTDQLLEHCSAVLFDNRLIMTAGPVETTHGVYHRGLIALDYNLISNMRSKAETAWEGLWTGLRVLQVVTGTVDHKSRCFMFALNMDEQIEVWEIEPTLKVDDYGTFTQPIQWRLELPSYDCTDPDLFKRLISGRAIIQNMVGEVDMTVRYRSDQNPCWQFWDQFSLCSKYKDCTPADCKPHEFREQQRSVIKMHMPADDFDETNGRRWCTGYEFQPRIEITGYCELKQFFIVCKDEPETLEAERSLV